MRDSNFLLISKRPKVSSVQFVVRSFKREGWGVAVTGTLIIIKFLRDMRTKKHSVEVWGREGRN